MKVQHLVSYLTIIGNLFLVTGPNVEARPPQPDTPQRQVQERLSIPNDIRLQLQAPDIDYQVFAPSAPTSGPQGIWKYGSCNNTVRVLVSNIGEDAGEAVNVTLSVSWSEKVPHYIDATQSVSYIVHQHEVFDETLQVGSLGAGEHQWLDFQNVEFPKVENYRLVASITPLHSGDDANNNQRSFTRYVNHSCS